MNALEVEGLCKQYRLGIIGTGTLKDDLVLKWAKLRGKDLNQYFKIGENDRLSDSKSEYVWALNDINFQVKQGEVLGIIGKNGAGKSTLLKILSKVTAPTKGEIRIKGRVASLLEVGTGFHPELTGKENIFLNGAILGMTKKEIRDKIDEIIDFSGIGSYIDTPVKRYSSGMYVRLAFAVAAHLEPEILIVDEVLAVGDAEFQKKCIGKMKDVSGKGRTVLFVSHNMGAVNALCDRCVMIKNGKLYAEGPTEKITALYLKDSSDVTIGSKIIWEKIESKNNYLNQAEIVNQDGLYSETTKVDSKFGIKINYTITEEGFKPVPQVVLNNTKGEVVFVASAQNVPEDFFAKGEYSSIVWIPAHFLNAKEYLIKCVLATMDPITIHDSRDGLNISVMDNLDAITRTNYKGDIPGEIRPLLNWEHNKV